MHNSFVTQGSFHSEAIHSEALFGHSSILQIFMPFYCGFTGWWCI